MARRNLVHVNFSLTTLNEELARTMEPRTSRPAARLEAVSRLSQAAVPVGVMTAPIIPGINDSEIPALLEAAAAAGAGRAGYVLLRLPLSVAPVFMEWLRRTRPTQAPRVESLIRGTREGKLNASQFGTRMCGIGQIAEQLEQTFRVFARRYHLDGPLPELDFSQFRPPQTRSGQLRLF
jgi:DNA repair photolyase